MAKGRKHLNINRTRQKYAATATGNNHNALSIKAKKEEHNLIAIVLLSSQHHDHNSCILHHRIYSKGAAKKFLASITHHPTSSNATKIENQHIKNDIPKNINSNHISTRIF